MIVGYFDGEKSLVLGENFLKLWGNLDDVSDICVLNARHNLPTACKDRADTDDFIFKHRLKLFYAEFVGASLNELPDDDYLWCFYTEFLTTLGEFLFFGEKFAKQVSRLSECLSCLFHDLTIARFSPNVNL